MRAVGVIPARWASTRFPGKMLHPIAGVPLIVRVVRRARQARGLDDLLVATDDERIREAVTTAAGIEVVMTPSDLPSGTDRVAAALRGRSADIVVNIQGDEPLLDPALVDALVDILRTGAWDLATAAAPLEDETELAKPSVVKVARAADGRALYFSRSPIPYVRDREPGRSLPPGTHLRHIGIYGYVRPWLERIVAEPPSRLEQLEKLEQLRALELGARMYVHLTADAGLGVDTPEDVARVESRLRELGEV